MRSMLFVPADSERKLAKSLDLGADALILDLEDSVAAARKPAGREMARGFIAAENGAQPAPLLYVRVNALGHGSVGGRPGCRDAGRTRRHHAAQAALGRGRAPPVDRARPCRGAQWPEPRRHPHRAIVTELPLSILQLPSYVGASTRLDALNWGMEDLSAEIGAATTRGPDGPITSPFRLARDLTLFTATAAGVQPLDAVYPEFRDLAGLNAECEAAARDGFTGKAAIHPDQVAVINAAFTPSPAEIERAATSLRLFQDSPGAGVISYNGQMLDRPHLVKAERLLARRPV